MINLYYLFNFLECGHFCINYVLKKDKIKNNLEYSRQMMSMKLLKSVLSEYYQYVKCYKIEGVIQDFVDYKPFITLLRLGKSFNHYIVVVRVEEKYVFYYDPLFLFLKKMKIKKFNQKWSKFCVFYFKKVELLT